DRRQRLLEPHRSPLPQVQLHGRRHVGAWQGRRQVRARRQGLRALRPRVCQSPRRGHRHGDRRGGAAPSLNHVLEIGPMKLTDVDLCNLETFGAGVPHHMFTLLRAEAPVFRHAEPDGGAGFWVVTKYEDVVTVSKNPGTFGSSQGTNIFTLAAEELAQLQT